MNANVWQKWSLTPLLPPPEPPTDKPVKLSTTGSVPILRRVPTRQKVVFITVDDGMEKDAKFLEMLQDLKTPITMFLANDAIKSDYGYFKRLQQMGNQIQNHTLHHPVISALPLSRQKEEVCGAQKAFTEQYGTPPLFFRPPYGVYNDNTVVAVNECGPRAIICWTEYMRITKLRYQEADKKLRPGDIILTHFLGSEAMTGMFRSLLKQVQQQGFSVARLEDYIQSPRAIPSNRRQTWPRR
ncbi:polysaccharide deacetylase family protein [Streptomyces sp. BK340]|uniref:polysaccharide deacetylase family protein n=1 Tax=Streptomyces sp. BK340 TaxID=2572903 RepID=UPI0021BD8034|nr:polysaccharide deacetylase family protein [Streptomyces sp. BK340]